MQRTRKELTTWFKEPLGRLLREVEGEALESVLQDLFGYYILQIGSVWDEGEALRSSRITNHVVLDDSIEGYADALPILSDSVDVVVLLHRLEFEPDPHEAVREATRVLVPEGRLIIIGFNPRGLWGLVRLMLKCWERVPWRGRFLSQTRVRDWLRLLGMDIEVSRPVFCRPPLQRPRLLRKLAFLENPIERWCPFMAGAYIVVARKRVTTMTPVKQKWRSPVKLVGPVIAEPTSRLHGRDSHKN